jgi:amino-acid N-acetyltransferase
MIAETKKERCLQIRSGTSADLSAVTDLLTRAGLPTAGVLAEALANFVIAENEGTPVGVAGLEIYRDSALLRSVAVAEEWRRAGVGRALIDRALDLTRERGIHDVYLLTTTAEHYFPRFGFVCVDRGSVPQALQGSAEFQGACPSSAVVMRKRVDA